MTFAIINNDYYFINIFNSYFLFLVVKRLPECAKCNFNEEPVEIENKIGFGSVLYNQNWLGFQLDRKDTYLKFEIK